MTVQIVELHDAGEALARARPFLVAKPTEHNLLLTILEHTIEFSLGGTFWLALDGPTVVGFGLQSPPGMGAVLAPMPAETCRRLAETITVSLPNVQGEAGAAAAFAGAWTERHHVAAIDPDAGRLYELRAVRALGDAPGGLRPDTPGGLRLGAPDDRETLVAWARAFAGETDTRSRHVEESVDL